MEKRNVSCKYLKSDGFLSSSQIIKGTSSVSSFWVCQTTYSYFPPIINWCCSFWTRAFSKLRPGKKYVQVPTLPALFGEYGFIASPLKVLRKLHNQQIKTSKCQAHQQRRLVLFSLSARAKKKKKMISIWGNWKVTSFFWRWFAS